eukprot:g7336.t1
MPSTPSATAQFSSNQVVPLTIDADVEPTTLRIEKAGSDAWCLEGLQWEGEDVLAPSTVLYVDVDNGAFGNCADGILNYFVNSVPEFQHSDVYPCLPQWRFFNLQADPAFEYELEVVGCNGVAPAVVTVFFCPDIDCNTPDVVIETLDNFNAGSTTFSVQVDYNPTAIKFLPYVHEWCADSIKFEQFTLDVEYPFTVPGGESRTIGNLQNVA